MTSLFAEECLSMISQDSPGTHQSFVKNRKTFHMHDVRSSYISVFKRLDLKLQSCMHVMSMSNNTFIRLKFAYNFYLSQFRF